MPFKNRITALRAKVLAKAASRHEAIREPVPDHPGPLSSHPPQRAATPSQAWVSPSTMAPAPAPVSPRISSFTIISTPVFPTSPNPSTMGLAPSSRRSAASSASTSPPPPTTPQFPALPFSRAPMTSRLRSLPSGLPLSTVELRPAAEARDSGDALNLSLGLNVTLLLLLFPILVPNFAVMVAAAGVHSALCGDAGYLEAALAVGLAVGLVYSPWTLGGLAGLFAGLLIDEMMGLPVDVEEVLAAELGAGAGPLSGMGDDACDGELEQGCGIAHGRR